MVSIQPKENAILLHGRSRVHGALLLLEATRVLLLLRIRFDPSISYLKLFAMFMGNFFSSEPISSCNNGVRRRKLAISILLSSLDRVAIVVCH